MALQSFQKILLTAFSLLIMFISLSWKYPHRDETNGSSDVVTNFDFSLPFIWPTDASKIVTNEFGAFRKTHFHEGIDISTNRRTGYKVFAVRSGSISRIRVSPYGYGKQLTMKHDDGTSSSFSHLSRFCDIIERTVKKEQHRAGGYEIDFSTENSALHFEQGDIIAFTGETGAGPPHLHFEVYDINMNPVNPLLIEAYKFDEFTPPIFGRMMLMPMTARSRVDGARKSKIFSTKKKNRSEYIVAQPIKISGDIGIAIYTEDVPDDERRLTGVYRLQLFVDDTLYYEAKFDSLQNGGAKQIALHYDYAGMKSRGAKFQKLFVDEGNRLPLYISDHQSHGIVNTEFLAPEQHFFKIISMDLAGNAATVTGTFISNHSPTISNFKLKNSTLSFSIENENIVQGITLSTKKNQKSEWRNREISFSKLHSTINSSKRREYFLPLADENIQSIKLVANTTIGTSSFPVFIVKDASRFSPPSAEISYEIFHREVIFTLKSNSAFSYKPTLSVKEGSKLRSISLNAIDLKTYEGAYIPSKIFIGERIVTLHAEVGGKEITEIRKFSLAPVAPENKAEFFSDDGGVKIYFERNAVFHSLFFSSNNNTYSGLPSYSLSPDDEILDKGISVSLFYPKNISPEKLGFFFNDDAGSWKFLPSRQNREGHSFTAKLQRSLGNVSLMYDSIPPTIVKLKITGKVIPIVTFSVRDGGSGVNLNDAKIYVDDLLVIPEVSEGGVYRTAIAGYAKGKHKLRIVVKDRMGNVAIKEQALKM